MMSCLFVKKGDVLNISTEIYSIKHSVVVALTNKDKYRVDFSPTQEGAASYKKFLVRKLNDGERIVLMHDQIILNRKTA